MAGETSVDMMLNVLPGTLTGIFTLNAGLSSINQQFQNMTKGVDNHFGIVEASIVSATALALQFGKTAADSFGEYEQGMKIVQAVSGQSSAAIAELGRTANEFSVKYRMDINELTEGLQTLGRAGLKSASEQTEVLENGLNTAKLEGRDLNSILQEIIQNTALLGGNLKSSNFGEQSEYVNDLLVATSMTAPINTHDISETLKYSGGMLAAAGGTITDDKGLENKEGKALIEDYMGAVASFAQKGVTGSIAGTALRAFFNKPATQDSSVVDALATIHLKPEYLWEDDQQTMKPVSEQIGLIQSQMDKLDVSQMDRLQIWSKIVGGKMGQQMIKLNSDDIKDVTKDIREANKAEDLATKSMQTYQSAMKETGEAGQQAMRSFGEHIARMLTPVSKMLTPILQALAHPVVSTSAFIGFIVLIGRAFQSVKKIFTGLRAEIGMVRTAMKSMILNQPARRQVVSGKLHGGGILAGYEDQQKFNAMRSSYYDVNNKVKETSAVVKSTGTTSVNASKQVETSLGKMYKLINDFKRIVTATNNRIKENVIEINEKIQSGINISHEKIKNSVVSSGQRIKTEYSKGMTESVTVFRREMEVAINTTMAKLKTGAATGFSGAIASQKNKTSRGQFLASNYPFLVSNPGLNQVMANGGQLSPAYQKLVASYNRQAELIEQQLAEVQSQKNIQATITFVEKKIIQEKKELSKLQEIYNAEFHKLEKFRKDNLTLDGQIAKEALKEYNYRLHQVTLLGQELTLREKQIGMIQRHIAQLEFLYMEEVNATKAKLLTYTARMPKGTVLTSGNTSGKTTTNTTVGVGGQVSTFKNTTTGKGGDDLTRTQQIWSQEDWNARKKNIAERTQNSRLLSQENVAKQETIRLENAYNERLAANMALLGGHYRPNEWNTGRFNRYNLPTLDSQDMARISAAQAARFPSSPAGAATMYNSMLVENQRALQRAQNVVNQSSLGVSKILTKDAMGYTRGRNPSIMGLEKLLPKLELEIATLDKTIVENNLVTRQLNGELSVVQAGGSRLPIYQNTFSSAALAEKEAAYQMGLVKNGAYRGFVPNWSYNSSKYGAAEALDMHKQYTQSLNTGANYQNDSIKAKPADAKNMAGLKALFGEDLTKKDKEILKTARLAREGQKTRMQSFKSSFSSLKDFRKGLSGARGALSKVTSFMGGPFFAGMMAVDVAMQLWNSAQQAYTEKLEKATQALDDAISKQEEAVQVFYEGRHEEGQAEIKGWNEENPDATLEEKEDALLGAYSDIYDSSIGTLDKLDANTRQLAIVTEEVKKAGDKVSGTYLNDQDFFSAKGGWSNFWHGNYSSNQSVQDIGPFFGNEELSGRGGYAIDKYGQIHGAWNSSSRNYFEGEEVILDDSWQTDENYPWLKEFSPILSADIWREKSTKEGLRLGLGAAGYSRLDDQLSSVGGWDQSAFTRHGYNIVNSFGTDKDQNRLQMAFKNYSSDLSKLAKQTRRFEKSTGSTAMKALNYRMGKFGNMKKALKDLSVQDPKLVNYIKSLAIKTGMNEQQVLMAAQLQQLQEMQTIAKDQVTPRMESLVGSAYQTVAYGGQTLSTVQGSGSGAISAAQNAAAIAALLNAEMETKLDEQNFQDYMNNLSDPTQRKYQTKEEFAAAVNKARNDGKDDWLDEYAKKKFTSYAATNFMMWNPNLSEADAAKRAEEWYNSLDSSVQSHSVYDTLRKGARGALTNQILAAYDQSLNEDEGGSSGGGGGSGSGDKDKDKDTGTRKERVDLVLCNRKQIPKLNVNLFKKPPSFTILNKNFKLRDVKINSEDKPKEIMAAIKNSFIDIQKRTDPKIIQDENSVYDPVEATEGKDLPSGSSKTKTNR